MGTKDAGKIWDLSYRNQVPVILFLVLQYFCEDTIGYAYAILIIQSGSAIVCV